MEPKYSPSDATLKRLRNNFTYHAPHGTQAERYTFLRSEAGKLADQLVSQCPESRELSVALTKLEEVMYWANAAIARNEVANG